VRARAIEQFVGVLGNPHSSTNYVLRWNLGAELDVVLERRGPEHRAVVWVPWYGNGTEPPLGGKVYTSDEGRHGHTYAFAPSLAEGLPALRITIEDDPKLESVMEKLRARDVASICGAPPADAEAEPTESPDDDTPLDLAPEHRRVETDKHDLPVETLHNWVSRGKLDLRPEFQRDFVWNRQKASRLVESLLLEIPIPVIYVAEEADGRMVVVDGQQRLTSICAYIEGRFPGSTDFWLCSLQVLRELNGKAFTELDESTREKILGATLRLIVIKNESDPDVKFEVFERLNLGSEKLSDQELRNSMYRGSYNRLLRDLVAHPTMLKVMHASRPHPRMVDRQLILRFFAMWRNTHLKVRSPMKQFLNREMEQNRELTAAEADRMRTVFERAIELAYVVFGPHVFRRFVVGDEAAPDGRWADKGLHVGLWDTVLYTFTFYEKRQVVPVADAVREELLDLMTHDLTFIDYLKSWTDRPERIRYRADEWRRRVDALVNEAEPRRFTLELKQRLFDANPTCRICGQRIHDADDAEVDHVKQYWRGGRTIPANARLSHRYCNRARGGR
jgi:hypothetical protein